MESKKQKIELIKSQIQNKKTELKILVEKQKNNVELFNDNLKFEIEDLVLDFHIVYGKWKNLEKSNKIYNWNENNWNSGEGYVICISNGKKDETKSVIEIRIPHKEYRDGLVLNSNEKFYDISPIILNYDNEKEDLEKYYNHKYIQNNIEKINRWIENNIPNCISTIQKPISILKMEIEILSSEVNKLNDELKNEGIRDVYEQKESEIPQTFELRSQYIDDDELEEIGYQFDIKLKKVKFNKISSSVLVKIKGENDLTHKDKHIIKLRNCKKLDKNRWKCEFNEWKDEWEEGIITDKNLLKYCKDVYEITKRFDDYIQKGISPDYDYYGYYRRNETLPPQIEFGKIYYKLNEEFISEQEFEKKTIYYRNEMILTNLHN
jgi:hypothetical protein